VRARLYYGWYVAAVTFLAIAVAAGVRSAPTMFVLPLEFEFHWSAATISVAIALGLLLYGLIGPFAAALMERIGVRRTVAGALVLLAVSSLLSVGITAPWQLIALWGICSGTGTGVISLALGATVANRWFEARRGLVMGVFASGTATGQLAFLPLFGVIIHSNGWRPCALILAAVCLALVPFFVIVSRERPGDLGLPKLGKSEPEPAHIAATNPLARAFSALGDGVRSRDFWLLAGSFAICGASTNGLIGTHLVPACGDHGIPETRAAGLLAAMGVFNLIGTTASGWLSDRYDARLLLFAYYGLRGLSLLFLPYAFSAQAVGLPIFAVFYGLEWIASVPPTLKLANASFGVGRGAVMFAWLSAIHQVGSASIAFGAGAIRTATGDYTPAFVTSGLLCLVGAALVLFVGRGIRKLQPITATT
jgi:MFS family permease